MALVVWIVVVGSPVSAGTEFPLTVHGITVQRIEPDHGVVLSDGFEIDGDPRLSGALRDGGAQIRNITLLLSMPPVYVVTFADGETRHYRSHKAP